LLGAVGGASLCSSRANEAKSGEGGGVTALSSSIEAHSRLISSTSNSNFERLDDEQGISII
jgi:hypothetical protein